MNINKFSEDVLKKLGHPLEVEGGKIFINRLVHLFGLRSKVELSDLIGVSTGSLATWQTRGLVPFELAIRVHLATGVTLEYLLFEDLYGDNNVMQYLKDPTTQPNYANIKHNLRSFHYSLSEPANYDGGAVLIERLVSLFKMSSKKDLGELLGVSIGTLGTWHTRKITPYELLCRIHLVTGISMHYLCFGKEWDDIHTVDHFKPKIESQLHFENCYIQLNTFDIDNGIKNPLEPYVLPYNFLKNIGLENKKIEVILSNNFNYFINSEIVNVTNGKYLLSINDLYQVCELRQMPDGNIYFFDGDDKYPINADVTKIHGKVVSILETV
ncbi:helix-turn-helix domain-containing protein [Shewanella scandinavica]|uniref:helix-turn-helix domain-containing protein n=1 Tax=Shewanella scandinavica TaxID=3063538 RepID=UPI003188BA10